MEKRPFIILAGPTAVGKSALSISLAKAVGGEIISCDSMQVYQYMDIVSAKITPEEMQGVPHYLVDVLPPTEDFHVARFVSMAKEAMEQIYANGHIPIAVGGTGFYIQALLYDADFSEEEHTPIREALEQEARTLGAETLHQRLKEVDPAEIWNAFAASSYNLFDFILRYDYKAKRDIEDHAALFCQLVILHPDEYRMTGKYATYQDIEYPIIYAK